MNSLISIIVPIYNVEKYIKKCIESIINQTYKNLEILLVDDGSLDNSSEICIEYSKKDPRIKIIKKKNGGLSDARNAGIKQAIGDYIIFVDGDDYIGKYTVEQAYQKIVAEKTDLVIWGYVAEFVDQNEKIIKKEFFKTDDVKYHKSNSYEIELNKNVINLLGYAWNKIYKTTIVKENDIYFRKNISLIEDISFNAEFLKKCNSFAFLDEVNYHYMQRERETLGVQFYENYFELKMEAIILIDNLLEYWTIDRKNKDILINQLIFGVVKSTIKKIVENSPYSIMRKKSLIRQLLQDCRVKKVISIIEPDNFKDKIILFLLMSRQINILYLIYSKKNSRSFN